VQLRRKVTVGGATTKEKPNELSVEARHADAATVVVAIGRVTVDSSPQLRVVLHDAIVAAARVVIDLRGISYLDTSAIATLLEAATLALAHGVSLRVTGLHDHPRFVAEGAELDHIFIALGHEVQLT
jgi:anti-anti-sigma factor